MSLQPIKLTPALSTQLNLIRMLAASGIMITHLLHVFVYRLSYKTLFLPVDLPFYSIAAGFFFVSVFFILSGFLITISLINNYATHGYINISHFMRRRIMRLLPTVILALALCLIITFIIKHFQLIGADRFILPNEVFPSTSRLDDHPYNYIATLLFVQRIFAYSQPALNPPLWTLGYEFWMYITALNIALVFTAKYNSHTTNVIAFALLLGMALFSMAPPYVYILYLCWLMGALLAWVYYQQWYQLPYVCLAAKLILISAVVLIAVLIMHEGLGVINVYYYMQQSAQYAIPLLLAIAMSTAVIATGFFKHSRHPAYLETTAKGARYAYTLYAIHYPLALLAFSLMGTRLQTLSTLQLTMGLISLFIIIHLIAYSCAKITEPIPKHKRPRLSALSGKPLLRASR